MSERLRGIFEPVKESAANGGTSHGCCNQGPTRRIGDGVAGAASQSAIGEKADCIGQRLEKDVRMQGERTQVEIDRKVDFRSLRSPGQRRGTVCG